MAEVEKVARELLADAMGLTVDQLQRKIRYNAGMARCDVTNALRAIQAAYVAGLVEAKGIAELHAHRNDGLDGRPREIVGAIQARIDNKGSIT